VHFRPQQVEEEWLAELQETLDQGLSEVEVEDALETARVEFRSSVAAIKKQMHWDHMYWGSAWSYYIDWPFATEVRCRVCGAQNV